MKQKRFFHIVCNNDGMLAGSENYDKAEAYRKKLQNEWDGKPFKQAYCKPYYHIHTVPVLD